MSLLPSRFRVPRSLSALGIAAALATLAACSGGSTTHHAVAGPGASGGNTATLTGPSSTGTTNAGAGPATSPAAGSTSTPAAAQANGTPVAIQNFKFVAATVTVKVGATVTWTNKDEDAHTVTAIGGPFHSPTLTNGGTFSYTFKTAGTFQYMCTIHPFMHGTVIVTG